MTRIAAKEIRKKRPYDFSGFNGRLYLKIPPAFSLPWHGGRSYFFLRWAFPRKRPHLLRRSPSDLPLSQGRGVKRWDHTQTPSSLFSPLIYSPPQLPRKGILYLQGSAR